MNKLSHSELWEKYLGGDDTAIGDLYKILFPKLFLFSLALTKDKEWAEDIVQDVFKKVLEEKNQSIDNLEGWLINAIRFSLRTHYRNNKTQLIHKNNYSEERLKYVLAYHTIDAEKLKKLVDENLSPMNAQIIHLTSQGYKNQEIASKLGLSERQVRNRKFDSKKKLKNIIRKEQF
ncbi:MAG: sigma-70 family RNA polymerase sigma factor [Bacteroidota bacterium]